MYFDITTYISMNYCIQRPLTSDMYLLFVGASGIQYSFFIYFKTTASYTPSLPLRHWRQMVILLLLNPWTGLERKSQDFDFELNIESLVRSRHITLQEAIPSIFFVSTYNICIWCKVCPTLMNINVTLQIREYSGPSTFSIIQFQFQFFLKCCIQT